MESRLKEATSEDARGTSRPLQPPFAATSGDAVEAALAAAIEGATRAGEWGIVAHLACELEARRLARAPNVVSLPRTRLRRP